MIDGNIIIVQSNIIKKNVFDSGSDRQKQRISSLEVLLYRGKKASEK